MVHRPAAFGISQPKALLAEVPVFARPTHDNRARQAIHGREDWMAGRVLGGRYELIDLLGTGGMATVWRGRDRNLGRVVAVKVIS
jgi:serine/threonine protein kinase